MSTLPIHTIIRIAFYHAYAHYLTGDDADDEMRMQAEIYQADLFDVYMHSDYMQDMQKSIRLIQEASIDAQTRALTDGFMDDCLEAYERGRDMRAAEEGPSEDHSAGASPSP